MPVLNQLSPKDPDSLLLSGEELDARCQETWRNFNLMKTADPDGSYSELKVKLPFTQTNIPDPLREKPENTLRLVCISDTHNESYTVSAHIT